MVFIFFRSVEPLLATALFTFRAVVDGSRGTRMDITVSAYGSVQPEEVIALYGAVGWGIAAQYNDDEIRRAFDSATCVVTARDNQGRLLGFVRVLSDGVYHTTIADIIVHPDVRRRSIGRRLMQIVWSLYGTTGIFLETDADNEAFFAACGFRKRPMIVMAARFVHTGETHDSTDDK